MSGLHWFPFYWDEYSSKDHAPDLRPAWRLYAFCFGGYTRPASLSPPSNAIASAQARLKQEISDTDAILAEFFEENKGFGTILKAEEVMAQAQEKQ